MTDANVNRSPFAYEANPAEERAKYESVGGNVDKEMTVLSFKKEDGTPLGLVILRQRVCRFYAVSLADFNHTG